MNGIYQSMIRYEYIDRHVHVEMLSTMVQLIIEQDDYAMRPGPYFDAKEKDQSKSFPLSLSFK